MANTGFKGIDIRQTGTALLFRAYQTDAVFAALGTGTTTYALYELQSDGTLKSYDFNDNTFKTTALTTATASMTHRAGNNGTVTTGIWTVALSTLTGFTAGAIYFVVVINATASPTQQVREFQYGSAEGDLVTTANGTGTAELGADVVFWKGSTAPANTGDGYARLGAPSGASVSADIAAIPTANTNADALLDRTSGVESNRTVRKALRLMLAALVGKLSGADTTSIAIRDSNDSKDRITAQVDSNGNRTAVTLDDT